MILLDEQTYQKQKQGMRDLVANIEAKDALDLSTRVFLWIAKKPKWERYRSHPVSFAMVWRKRERLA